MTACAQHRRTSEIIHAVHGVTSSGNWFLLADVKPKLRASDYCRDAVEHVVDDTWLVVLGWRDRDIITLQGRDVCGESHH